MRKISPAEILIATALLLGCLTVAAMSGFFLHHRLPPGDYRAVLVLGAAGLTYLLAYLCALRAVILLFPFPEGPIEPGTPAERRYHMTLTLLFFGFHPICKSGLLPLPLTRPFYRFLGARIGENSYTAGIILDPQFVTIGRGTLLGASSLIVPHVIEGTRISHFRIRIGSGVTLGAHSIVMAGAEIGDGAIVAMNSVVTKGARIGPGETWGGTPARRLSV